MKQTIYKWGQYYLMYSPIWKKLSQNSVNLMINSVKPSFNDDNQRGQNFSSEGKKKFRNIKVQGRQVDKQVQRQQGKVRVNAQTQQYADQVNLLIGKENVFNRRLDMARRIIIGQIATEGNNKNQNSHQKVTYPNNQGMDQVLKQTEKYWIDYKNQVKQSIKRVMCENDDKGQGKFFQDGVKLWQDQLSNLLKLQLLPEICQSDKLEKQLVRDTEEKRSINGQRIQAKYQVNQLKKRIVINQVLRLMMISIDPKNLNHQLKTSSHNDSKKLSRKTQLMTAVLRILYKQLKFEDQHNEKKNLQKQQKSKDNKEDIEDWMSVIFLETNFLENLMKMLFCQFEEVFVKCQYENEYSFQYIKALVQLYGQMQHFASKLSHRIRMNHKLQQRNKNKPNQSGSYRKKSVHSENDPSNEYQLLIENFVNQYKRTKQQNSSIKFHTFLLEIQKMKILKQVDSKAKAQTAQNGQDHQNQLQVQRIENTDVKIRSNKSQSSEILKLNRIQSSIQKLKKDYNKRQNQLLSSKFYLWKLQNLLQILSSKYSNQQELFVQSGQFSMLNQRITIELFETISSVNQFIQKKSSNSISFLLQTIWIKIRITQLYELLHQLHQNENYSDRIELNDDSLTGVQDTKGGNKRKSKQKNLKPAKIVRPQDIDQMIVKIVDKCDKNIHNFQFKAQIKPQNQNKVSKLPIHDFISLLFHLRQSYQLSFQQLYSINQKRNEQNNRENSLKKHVEVQFSSSTIPNFLSRLFKQLYTLIVKDKQHILLDKEQKAKLRQIIELFQKDSQIHKSSMAQTDKEHLRNIRIKL